MGVKGVASAQIVKIKPQLIVIKLFCHYCLTPRTDETLAMSGAGFKPPNSEL
jgi:hypothetical protein